MRHLSFLLKLLYHIYAFVLFVALMLVVLPFVAIAALFGRITGGNMVVKICRFWADCMLFLGGIRHRNIYLAPQDPKKRYVFVVNHISYTDPPIIIKTIRKQNFRILGKYEMTRFPVFGFIYRNATIMVDRSTARKRAESVYQLKKIIAKNISIVIFPEGTFNETHRPLKRFFDGAFRIAIETQTPIKPILLLDTHKRLDYKNLFSLTPGKSRAVFLEEIPVDGLTMKDIDALKDRVHREMEEKLLFFKADWIKENEINKV